MIVSMRRLKFTCDEPDCKRRATYEINDRTPQNKHLAIDSTKRYCDGHIPEHAVEWWDWMAQV